MTDPKVLQIQVDYNEKEKTVRLSKGTNGDDYEISEDGKALYIKPTAGIPAFLKFKANVEIQGICFSDNTEAIEPVKCHKAGTCGGCFTLLADFAAKSLETPEIQNDYKKTPLGYTFWFYFPNGRVDPQIYNHGQTTWPDDAPRRAGCLGTIGRLVAGLRGHR